MVNVYLQGYGKTNTPESSFAKLVSVTCFMEQQHNNSKLRGRYIYYHYLIAIRLSSKCEYVACIRRLHSESSILTFNLHVRTMRDSSQLYDNMTFRFICGCVKFYQSFTDITPIYQAIHLWHNNTLPLASSTHRTTSVQYMPFHFSTTD